jgi:hypothetical protein
VTYRADHLAKEAERLLADEILNRAWDDCRKEALEALVTAPAEDPIAVIRAQQRVLMIEQIRAQLGRYILAVDDGTNGATPYA